MAPAKAPKRAVLDGASITSSSAAARRDGLVKRCQIDGLKTKSRGSRSVSCSNTAASSRASKPAGEKAADVATPTKGSIKASVTVVKSPPKGTTTTTAFGRTIRLCNTCSKAPRQKASPKSPRSAPRSAGRGGRSTPRSSKTWRELMNPQVSPSTRRSLIMKDDSVESGKKAQPIKSQSKDGQSGTHENKTASCEEGAINLDDYKFAEGDNLGSSASAGDVETNAKQEAGDADGIHGCEGDMENVARQAPETNSPGTNSVESIEVTVPCEDNTLARDNHQAIRSSPTASGPPPPSLEEKPHNSPNANNNDTDGQLDANVVPRDKENHKQAARHVKFASPLSQGSLLTSPETLLRSSVEMNELLTPQLDQAIADIEASASIPHLEFTVLDLESKVSCLTDELIMKNVQIDELLRIVKDKERQLDQEQFRRLEAEAREKTAKEEARSSALEQVRMAMSPEGDKSNRQASVRGHEVTRLSDRLDRAQSELKKEKAKRLEEVRKLDKRCKDEVRRAREAKDALFSANVKQLELHGEVARLRSELQKKEGLKREDCFPGVQAELDGIRDDFEKLKVESRETLESTETCMRRTHESLLAYVAEEVDARQESSTDYIRQLQEELDAALDHISHLENDVNKKPHQNDVVHTPSSRLKAAAIVEASPVPNMESWKKFTARFRRALAGQLSFDSCSEQKLDEMGMIRAEKLFKELCFSCSTPPLAAKRQQRLGFAKADSLHGRLYDDALYFDAINPESEYAIL